MTLPGSFLTNSIGAVHGRSADGYDQEPVRTTAGLRSLQSAEEKSLFDIVENLRKLDVNHELSLPQLVVCGSQSSGKSSVLEAISGIPFPKGDLACTRFVTVIQYQRGDEEHLQVEIVPDKSRDPGEKKILSEAKFVNRDLFQLSAMVKEAEKKMGLGNNQGFARDVLLVKITGQNYQPLTLVDLPGLIESHSRGSEHILYVKSIVDDWITQERAIILTVVEANSDPQRQAILTRAKEVDPYGRRTFGIITKPDAVEHGSGLERCWIDHAQNVPDGRAEFSFKKGWHVLRNRTYGERQGLGSDRDATERQFFLDPNRNWHVVDQRYWGIDRLRKRLRTLLYEETKRQLPRVRKDITTKIECYTKELRSLEDRLQRPDQLWVDYNNEGKELAVIAKIGVDGKHNHPFFADVDADPSRDIRARIEILYDNFSEEMVTDGHGRGLPGDESALSGSNEGYIREVEEMLQKTKGEELPGHVDPQRMNLMFWRHSKHWSSNAQVHVDQAYSLCLAFVTRVIHAHFQARLPAIPQVVFQKILDFLEDSLEKQKDRAREELAKLDADRERTIKTRNRIFAERSAQKAMASEMRAKASEDDQAANNRGLGTWKTPAAFPKSSELGTLRQKAETLADVIPIYYEIARDVFVSNVIVQVIERHLLATLHTLFHGDFGITQADFRAILSDEDNGALQTAKQELEDKISKLKACEAALR